jgi:triacylglycerol lipase
MKPTQNQEAIMHACGSPEHQHGGGLKALVAAACLAGCGDQALQSAQAEEDVKRAASASGQTRYPIVLVHGMSGFTNLLGVLEYFYGIPEAMRGAGATVFVTQASPFNSVELRGEQVLAQIESIVARTGSGKVNLIGHSQGGLDVRYVAAVRPDLIASVTTVGTPHKGAALADFLRAHLSNGGFDEVAVAALADSLGFLLGLLEGRPTLPQDAVAGLDSLTSAGTATFNKRYPNGVPGSSCGQGDSSAGNIRYYSWSGTTVLTNVLDTTDAGLFLASLVYPEDNDGLVGRCSSHFGTVIRDNYGMNHLDEVNQLFGLTSWFGSSPQSLFRAHASRLKAQGL